MADRGSACTLRGGRGGGWGHDGLLAVSIDIISDFAKATYCVLYHLDLATLDEYPMARFAVEVLLPLNTPIIFALFLK